MPKNPPLCIAHIDAESGFSGGEVQVFLLMEGLRAQGYRNILLSPPESRAAARALDRGFETRTIAMRGDLDISAVIDLAHVLRTLHPDLVHLHTGRATWLGGLAARAADIPAITTRRMDRAVHNSWRTRLVYRRLTRQAVAISPAVRALLVEGGVDPSRIHVIPSAIDPARVLSPRGRSATRASLRTTDEDFVLLTLASLVPRKGIDVLVDALAELPAARHRIRAFVAGEGPIRAELESRAQVLDVPVTFLGRREDAGDLLAACDAFVLPARREGLGVSALEAMAASRPVIASRVGGLAEAVLHERTGLLVPPDDPRALAKAIERLAVDRDLARTLGAAGPARVADGHLPEQMVSAYMELYASVLSGESARA
jgi:glycosyltransferase involved in cell wall biosynthesis